MLMQTLHNFIAMNMDMLSNTRIQWETSTTNESSFLRLGSLLSI